MFPIELELNSLNFLPVFKHACALGCSGRSRDWLKFKNPAAPAVRREAEKDWGKGAVAVIVPGGSRTLSRWRGCASPRRGRRVLPRGVAMKRMARAARRRQWRTMREVGR